MLDSERHNIFKELFPSVLQSVLESRRSGGTPLPGEPVEYEEEPVTFNSIPITYNGVL